jgi:pyruvate/2-oxoglutarate dehydrogenase complex dihydrolipoamide dehydrogenase (E3) component
MNFLTYEDSTRFIIQQNKLFQLVHQGRFLEFDMAIVSAGVLPNNYLAKDAGLKLGSKGGLIIDSRLRTSDPNIYAAGDNIEIKNRITNNYDYFPLATHAHHYGHIAGENAAGGNKIAEPIILNSAFKFRGKYITRVGLSQDEAEEHFVNSKFVTAIADNKVKVMPNSEKVFGKIIFNQDNKLILGASFMGGEEVSGYADIVSTFIFNKISASGLSKINFNYTPPLSPFINLLSILGRKILEISK